MKALLFNCIARTVVFFAIFSYASGFYVTVPQSPSDWSSLARVVSQTFDSPGQDDTLVDRFKWNLYERFLVQSEVYRRYVSTARKLRHAKYSILIARGQENQVIGVAELGISSTENTTTAVLPFKKRTLIGLVCVSTSFRKQGVGEALVKECEKVAQLWGEDMLFAEVEENNTQALAFFNKLGYSSAANESMQMVVQRRRLKTERRPHVVLSRVLVPEAKPL